MKKDCNNCKFKSNRPFQSPCNRCLYGVYKHNVSLPLRWKKRSILRDWSSRLPDWVVLLSLIVFLIGLLYIGTLVLIEVAK